MRVTVWHNMHPDHFWGYEPTHPMLRVFSYTVPDTDPDPELWRAVTVFNADQEFLAGDDAATATAYRARRLRSFSKGDGLSVRTGDAPERFWVSDGLHLLPQAGGYPELAAEGGHGSVPLGHLVAYLLPAGASFLREGRFELAEDTHDCAEQAAADHHGVDPGQLLVIGVIR